MNKDRMLEIINKIDNLSKNYNDYELITATYILFRYGEHTCINYIDSSDIEKIIVVIKSHATIFNEQLNYEIDKILNNKQN